MSISHFKLKSQKQNHHHCSEVVSAATAVKGNLLSVFTACECVEPLFYIMSALIHSMFSVLAFRRVNFSMDKKSGNIWEDRVSRRWKWQIGKLREKKAGREGKTETVGVKSGLPPFPLLTLFPLFCLYYPLSLSLSCLVSKWCNSAEQVCNSHQ